MRQLLPEAADDVDLLDCYARDARPALADRPWVMCNMISSADGSTAVEGRSGALGGPADKAVFAAIRHVADLIVVGSGTAKAENYGPPVMSEAATRARLERGQAAQPRLAIVSGSLGFDLSSRLFTGWPEGTRPLVVTSESAPAERRDAVDAVADLVTVGGERVTIDGILHAAADVGASVVLVEGGPSLNGEFVIAGVLDELCLTIAPLLTAGRSSSVAVNDRTNVLGLRIDRLLEQDGLLFCRYVNAASVPSPS